MHCAHQDSRRAKWFVIRFNLNEYLYRNINLHILNHFCIKTGISKQKNNKKTGMDKVNALSSADYLLGW